jgi:hypothetical protein
LLRENFVDEQVVGFVPVSVDVFHRRFARRVDVGEQVVRDRRRRAAITIVAATYFQVLHRERDYGWIFAHLFGELIFAEPVDEG